jgi:hypothetical protein
MLGVGVKPTGVLFFVISFYYYRRTMQETGKCSGTLPKNYVGEKPVFFCADKFLCP